MAYLSPVDEIGTLEDGHSGEERERGVDQIVGIARPTEGWVRIKTCQDGVEILVCGIYGLVEATVISRIGKIGERGVLCPCRDTAYGHGGSNDDFLHTVDIVDTAKTFLNEEAAPHDVTSRNLSLYNNI